MAGRLTTGAPAAATRDGALAGDAAALTDEAVELAAARIGGGGAAVVGGAGIHATESKTVSATTARSAGLAWRKRRRSASEEYRRGPFSGRRSSSLPAPKATHGVRGNPRDSPPGTPYL